MDAKSSDWFSDFKSKLSSVSKSPVLPHRDLDMGGARQQPFGFLQSLKSKTVKDDDDKDNAIESQSGESHADASKDSAAAAQDTAGFSLFGNLKSKFQGKLDSIKVSEDLTDNGDIEIKVETDSGFDFFKDISKPFKKDENAKVIDKSTLIDADGEEPVSFFEKFKMELKKDRHKNDHDKTYNDKDDRDHSVFSAESTVFVQQVPEPTPDEKWNKEFVDVDLNDESKTKLIVPKLEEPMNVKDKPTKTGWFSGIKSPFAKRKAKSDKSNHNDEDVEKKSDSLFTKQLFGDMKKVHDSGESSKIEHDTNGVRTYDDLKVSLRADDLHYITVKRGNRASLDTDTDTSGDEDRATAVADVSESIREKATPYDAQDKQEINVSWFDELKNKANIFNKNETAPDEGDNCKSDERVLDRAGDESQSSTKDAASSNWFDDLKSKFNDKVDNKSSGSGINDTSQPENEDKKNLFSFFTSKSAKEESDMDGKPSVPKNEADAETVSWFSKLIRKDEDIKSDDKGDPLFATKELDESLSHNIINQRFKSPVKERGSIPSYFDKKSSEITEDHLLSENDMESMPLTGDQEKSTSIYKSEKHKSSNKPWFKKVFNIGNKENSVSIEQTKPDSEGIDEIYSDEDIGDDINITDEKRKGTVYRVGYRTKRGRENTLTAIPEVHCEREAACMDETVDGNEEFRISDLYGESKTGVDDNELSFVENDKDSQDMTAVLMGKNKCMSSKQDHNKRNIETKNADSREDDKDFFSFFKKKLSDDDENKKNEMSAKNDKGLFSVTKKKQPDITDNDDIKNEIFKVDSKQFFSFFKSDDKGDRKRTSDVSPKVSDHELNPEITHSGTGDSPTGNLTEIDETYQQFSPSFEKKSKENVEGNNAINDTIADSKEPKSAPFPMKESQINDKEDEEDKESDTENAGGFFSFMNKKSKSKNTSKEVDKKESFSFFKKTPAAEEKSKDVEKDKLTKSNEPGLFSFLKKKVDIDHHMQNEGHDEITVKSEGGGILSFLKKESPKEDDKEDNQDGDNQEEPGLFSFLKKESSENKFKKENDRLDDSVIQNKELGLFSFLKKKSPEQKDESDVIMDATDDHELLTVLEKSPENEDTNKQKREEDSKVKSNEPGLFSFLKKKSDNEPMAKSDGNDKTVRKNEIGLFSFLEKKSPDIDANTKVDNDNQIAMKTSESGIFSFFKPNSPEADIETDDTELFSIFKNKTAKSDSETKDIVTTEDTAKQGESGLFSYFKNKLQDGEEGHLKVIGNTGEESKKNGSDVPYDGIDDLSNESVPDRKSNNEPVSADSTSGFNASNMAKNDTTFFSIFRKKKMKDVNSVIDNVASKDRGYNNYVSSVDETKNEESEQTINDTKNKTEEASDWFRKLFTKSENKDVINKEIKDLTDLAETKTEPENDQIAAFSINDSNALSGIMSQEHRGDGTRNTTLPPIQGDISSEHLESKKRSSKRSNQGLSFSSVESSRGNSINVDGNVQRVKSPEDFVNECSYPNVHDQDLPLDHCWKFVTNSGTIDEMVCPLGREDLERIDHTCVNEHLKPKLHSCGDGTICDQEENIHLNSLIPTKEEHDSISLSVKSEAVKSSVSEDINLLEKESGVIDQEPVSCVNDGDVSPKDMELDHEGADHFSHRSVDEEEFSSTDIDEAFDEYVKIFGHNTASKKEERKKGRKKKKWFKSIRHKKNEIKLEDTRDPQEKDDDKKFLSLFAKVNTAGDSKQPTEETDIILKNTNGKDMQDWHSENLLEAKESEKDFEEPNTTLNTNRRKSWFSNIFDGRNNSSKHKSHRPLVSFENEVQNKGDITEPVEKSDDEDTAKSSVFIKQDSPQRSSPQALEQEANPDVSLVDHEKQNKEEKQWFKNIFSKKDKKDRNIGKITYPQEHELKIGSPSLSENHEVKGQNQKEAIENNTGFETDMDVIEKQLEDGQSVSKTEEHDMQLANPSEPVKTTDKNNKSWFTKLFSRNDKSKHKDLKREYEDDIIDNQVTGEVSNQQYDDMEDGSINNDNKETETESLNDNHPANIRITLTDCGPRAVDADHLSLSSTQKLDEDCQSCGSSNVSVSSSDALVVNDDLSDKEKKDGLPNEDNHKEQTEVGSAINTKESLECESKEEKVSKKKQKKSSGPQWLRGIRKRFHKTPTGSDMVDSQSECDKVETVSIQDSECGDDKQASDDVTGDDQAARTEIIITQAADQEEMYLDSVCPDPKVVIDEVKAEESEVSDDKISKRKFKGLHKLFRGKSKKGSQRKSSSRKSREKFGRSAPGGSCESGLLDVDAATKRDLLSDNSTLSDIDSVSDTSLAVSEHSEHLLGSSEQVFIQSETDAPHSEENSVHSEHLLLDSDQTSSEFELNRVQTEQNMAFSFKRINSEFDIEEGDQNIACVELEEIQKSDSDQSKIGFEKSISETEQSKVSSQNIGSSSEKFTTHYEETSVLSKQVLSDCEHFEDGKTDSYPSEKQSFTQESNGLDDHGDVTNIPSEKMQLNHNQVEKSNRVIYKKSNLANEQQSAASPFVEQSNAKEINFYANSPVEPLSNLPVCEINHSNTNSIPVGRDNSIHRVGVIYDSNTLSDIHEGDILYDDRLSIDSNGTGLSSDQVTDNNDNNNTVPHQEGEDNATHGCADAGEIRAHTAGDLSMEPEVHADRHDYVNVHQLHVLSSNEANQHNACTESVSIGHDDVSPCTDKESNHTASDQQVVCSDNARVQPLVDFIENSNEDDLLVKDLELQECSEVTESVDAGVINSEPDGSPWKQRSCQSGLSSASASTDIDEAFSFYAEQHQKPGAIDKSHIDSESLISFTNDDTKSISIEQNSHDKVNEEKALGGQQLKNKNSSKKQNKDIVRWFRNLVGTKSPKDGEVQQIVSCDTQDSDIKVVRTSDVKDKTSSESEKNSMESFLVQGQCEGRDIKDCDVDTASDSGGLLNVNDAHVDIVSDNTGQIRNKEDEVDVVLNNDAYIKEKEVCAESLLDSEGYVLSSEEGNEVLSDNTDSRIRSPEPANQEVLSDGGRTVDSVRTVTDEESSGAREIQTYNVLAAFRRHYMSYADSRRSTPSMEDIQEKARKQQETLRQALYAHQSQMKRRSSLKNTVMRSYCSTEDLGHKVRSDDESMSISRGRIDLEQDEDETQILNVVKKSLEDALIHDHSPISHHSSDDTNVTNDSGADPFSADVCLQRPGHGKAVTHESVKLSSVNDDMIKVDSKTSLNREQFHDSSHQNFSSARQNLHDSAKASFNDGQHILSENRTVSIGNYCDLSTSCDEESQRFGIPVMEPLAPSYDDASSSVRESAERPLDGATSVTKKKITKQASVCTRKNTASSKQNTPTSTRVYGSFKKKSSKSPPAIKRSTSLKTKSNSVRNKSETKASKLTVKNVSIHTAKSTATDQKSRINEETKNKVSLNGPIMRYKSKRPVDGLAQVKRSDSFNKLRHSITKESNVSTSVVRKDKPWNTSKVPKSSSYKQGVMNNNSITSSGEMKEKSKEKTLDVNILKNSNLNGGSTSVDRSDLINVSLNTLESMKRQLQARVQSLATGSIPESETKAFTDDRVNDQIVRDVGFRPNKGSCPQGMISQKEGMRATNNSRPKPSFVPSVKLNNSLKSLKFSENQTILQPMEKKSSDSIVQSKSFQNVTKPNLKGKNIRSKDHKVLLIAKSKTTDNVYKVSNSVSNAAERGVYHETIVPLHVCRAEENVFIPYSSVPVSTNQSTGPTMRANQNLPDISVTDSTDQIDVKSQIDPCEHKSDVYSSKAQTSTERNVAKKQVKKLLNKSKLPRLSFHASMNNLNAGDRCLSRSVDGLNKMYSKENGQKIDNRLYTGNPYC